MASRTYLLSQRLTKSTRTCSDHTQQRHDVIRAASEAFILKVDSMVLCVRTSVRWMLSHWTVNQHSVVWGLRQESLVSTLSTLVSTLDVRRSVLKEQLYLVVRTSMCSLTLGFSMSVSPFFTPVKDSHASWNFYWKISRTWKVLENYLRVLGSPGIW